MTDTVRNTTALGRLVAGRRQDLGLSVSALARDIGKSRTYISGIENGNETITKPETFEVFAQALDVNVDRLYAAAGVIPDDIAGAIIGLPADDLLRLRQFLERLTSEDR